MTITIAPASVGGSPQFWNRLMGTAAIVLMVVVGLLAPSLTDKLTVLIPAVFFVVGWVILRRDPAHVEGRLLLATSLAWGVALTTPFEGTWVLPIGMMGTHLLLRYPDGHLPSRRWTWFSHACTAMILVNATLISTGSKIRESGGPNPYYVAWTEPLTIVLVTLPLCLLGSLAAVFVRNRRGSIIERAQIRWLAAAAVVVVTLYVVTLASSFAYSWAQEIDSSSSSWFAGGNPLWLQILQSASLCSFVLIPIAFGIAITRYHLYEIDRLVSRTTSYALVTGVVLATYVIVVTAVLRLLPDSSNLAVASATLAAAAIARPAVRRVQRVVDRRFDRTRYDQLRTVETFGDDVRHLVDPQEVTAALMATVRSTLQPSTTALWAGRPS